jgi:tRNA_anti-like
LKDALSWRPARLYDDADLSSPEDLAMRPTSFGGAVLALIACLAASEGQQSAPADKKEKAEVVDARKLLDEFTAKEEETSKKYANKLLETEGVVYFKGDAERGKPLIIHLIETSRQMACFCRAACKCGCPTSLVASGNFTDQDALNLLIQAGRLQMLTAAQEQLFKELSAADYDAYVKKPPLVIVCQFEPGSTHHEKAAQLPEGQKVKVRGRYFKTKFKGPNKTSVTPGLGECELVEISPYPVVAAEQLTKDFTTNQQAARAKYQRTPLIIDGTVAQTDEETLYLNGHDPKAEKPLRVTIFNCEKDELSKLKPGQKVKVKVQGEHCLTANKLDFLNDGLIR